MFSWQDYGKATDVLCDKMNPNKQNEQTARRQQRVNSYQKQLDLRNRLNKLVRQDENCDLVRDIVMQNLKEYQLLSYQRNADHPLYIAFMCGCEKNVAALESCDIVRLFSKSVDMPLMFWAVRENNVSDVEAFIARANEEQLDAMRQYTTNEGNTLLHLANRYASAKMVRLLLGIGCDPNVKNNEGDTAMHTASFQNDIKIVEAYFADNRYIAPDLRIRNAKGQLPEKTTIKEKISVYLRRKRQAQTAQEIQLIKQVKSRVTARPVAYQNEAVRRVREKFQKEKYQFRRDN